MHINNKPFLVLSGGVLKMAFISLRYIKGGNLMKKLAEKSRVSWVDTAKGLAIVLVVYGHALEGTYADMSFNSISYNLQHSLIYSFHMPLFFILSGYFVHSWLKREIKLAVKQKATSLLIPYIIWSLLQGALMVITHSKSTLQLGWKTLFIIPIRPIDQFWFIYALFFGFIVFYYLHKLFRNIQFIIIVTFILLVISSYISTWQFYNILTAVFYMELGYYFHNTGVLMKLDSWITIGSITVIFLICFSSVFYLMPSLLTNVFYKVILAILGSAMVIGLAQKLNSDWLMYLGRLSLEIYVAHWIFLAGTRIILNRMGFYNVVIIIGGSTLAGIFMSVIMYDVLNRLNLSKFMFGR